MRLSVISFVMAGRICKRTLGIRGLLSSVQCPSTPTTSSRALSTSPSSGATSNLRGIFPPMPTPFTDDGSVSYDNLAKNVTRWNTYPFRGLVVQGSNGEYVYLTSEERIELVQRVRDCLPQDSGKLILAGSGCESTRATVEMSQKMAKAGADAVMVVTPSYYKAGMKDKALHAHFTAVADNSPVPVILYSVPAFTVIDLSVDVIVDLAHHPNIIGLKESGGDITKIGSIIHRTKDADFQVIAGSAGFLLASLQLGGVGGVSALANVLCEDVCRLQQLAEEGNLEEAVKLQYKLIAPNSAVTKDFGIPGLKQVMDWMGFYGGPTRSPLQPLSEPDAIKLRNVFEKSGYL